MQEDHAGKSSSLNQDVLPAQDAAISVQVTSVQHPEGDISAPRIRGEGPALPAVQEIALQRLAAGSSISEAAKAARVDRRTVSRWIHSDPQFAAAYNAWHHEMLASGRARLLAMTDLALDTVHSAIAQGDARIAVQVAKATGVMEIPKPGLTEPGRLHRRKRLRDARWQEALAKAELDAAFNKRSAESHRSPQHCEYVIDSYVKCCREALRAESPEDRARRLEEQPRYRRNYDPVTLRLLATLDAEDIAAAPAADAPPLDPPKRQTPPREPSGNPELLTWRERHVFEQLRRKMRGEAVQVEEVTLARWEVEAINAARDKLLDDGFIPGDDMRVVPGPRDPCGSGRPTGDRKQLESRAVPPRALPAPSPAAPPAPPPPAPPDPFLTGEDEG